MVPSKSLTWDFPEGATFGDLQDFLEDAEGFSRDSRVKVLVKFGGKVKKLTLEPAS